MTNATSASPKLKAHYAGVMKCLRAMKERTAGDEDLYAKKNESVSGWSVGEQIEHTFKSCEFMTGIINMSLAQKTPKADGKPKFIGKVLLFTGRIPRGKGQSPAPLLPQAGGNMEKLRATAARVEALIGSLEAKLGQIEACTHQTPHPAAGPLNAAQWMRFMQIHADHHAKIIREIAG